MFKLLPDWREVLLRAWSIRLILLTAVLSGLEVVVSLLDADLLGMPPGAFAALAGLISIAATIARLVQQSGIWSEDLGRDESGALRRRHAAGVAGVAAAIAIALAITTIAPWEGKELRAYRDIVGIPTICFGETEGVKMGDVATEAECRTQLAKRVAQFEAEIRPCLPLILPERTRAAFISAAYNIGSHGFCRSSMSRRALAGDLLGACDALLMWNKAGGRVVRGLTNRRKAERELCLSGL
ncbi:lysozyme [Thioclava sp. GXIMD2076]|uniref:lysozyme n=1 Tax=Thioclava sp. GXIMD2076 TaxID=3131931 RepID=UPI0030D48183